MPVYLYILSEPDTGAIRYVGKTTSVKRRRHRHGIDADPTDKCHRMNWVRKLLAQGKRPVLDVLFEVSEDKWAEFEKAYIKIFRAEGCDLVNTTEGGESSSMKGEKHYRFGQHCSEVTKQRISQGLLGPKNPNYGKPKLPEVKQKMSEAQKGPKNHRFGKINSIESNAKRSESLRRFYQLKKSCPV